MVRQENFAEISLNTFEFAFLSFRKQFLVTQNESESATVNEPSVFESLNVLLYTFPYFCRQLKKRLKSPQKRSTRILQDQGPRDPLKVGILGCGRLGSQLAHCLITYGGINPKDIKISTRRPETLGMYSCYINRNVRKHTFRHVRPTKTQISLRIRAVWSESSLAAWRNFASLSVPYTPSEDSYMTWWHIFFIHTFVHQHINTYFW